MEKITFEVLGSSPEPYTVRFIRNSPSELSAFCSCRAGENGQHCKHRIMILQGDKKSIVSDNSVEVATVESWFKGSNIEKKLQSVHDLEFQQKKLKTLLAAAKKDLANSMRS